ncbi:hypothetical protein B0H16DRAFT_1810447 [Mycena metata]|uniref:Uncharacterized protein n=1 Tax=Mycena metata TaxID=1033252 RepID=A0AAD7MF06_9AGAR|nr:hypothetical protein B0H16DRAFT_1810447 [Mycena metata]
MGYLSSNEMEFIALLNSPNLLPKRLNLLRKAIENQFGKLLPLLRVSTPTSRTATARTLRQFPTNSHEFRKAHTPPVAWRLGIIARPLAEAPGERQGLVSVVVGAAWDLARDWGDDTTLQDVSYLIFCDVQSDLKKVGRRRIKEYVEGGGVEHFASMLRRHLDRAIVTLVPHLSITGIILLLVP